MTENKSALNIILNIAFAAYIALEAIMLIVRMIYGVRVFFEGTMQAIIIVLSICLGIIAAGSYCTVLACLKAGLKKNINKVLVTIAGIVYILAMTIGQAGYYALLNLLFPLNWAGSWMINSIHTIDILGSLMMIAIIVVCQFFDKIKAYLFGVLSVLTLLRLVLFVFNLVYSFVKLVFSMGVQIAFESYGAETFIEPFSYVLLVAIYAIMAIMVFKQSAAEKKNKIEVAANNNDETESLGEDNAEV